MIPDIYYVNSENEKIDLLKPPYLCRQERLWIQNGSMRVKKRGPEEK